MIFATRMPKSLFLNHITIITLFWKIFSCWTIESWQRCFAKANFFHKSIIPKNLLQLDGFSWSQKLQKLEDMLNLNLKEWLVLKSVNLTNDLYLNQLKPLQVYTLFFRQLAIVHVHHPTLIFLSISSQKSFHDHLSMNGTISCKNVEIHFKS